MSTWQLIINGPGYFNTPYDLPDGQTSLGRADDNEATVANRLRVFDEATEPLIGYYRERGLLRVVDAAQDEDAVTAAILDAIGAGD